MSRTQLPQVAFSILLALSLRPRHGYEIMKQVAEDSDGRLSLGPGALYTSIRNLEEQGLIAEVDDADGDQRRRQYTLTDTGREALDAETAFYRKALTLARRRRRAWPAGPEARRA